MTECQRVYGNTPKRTQKDSYKGSTIQYNAEHEILPGKKVCITVLLLVEIHKAFLHLELKTL